MMFCSNRIADNKPRFNCFPQIRNMARKPQKFQLLRYFYQNPIHVTLGLRENQGFDYNRQGRALS